MLSKLFDKSTTKLALFLLAFLLFFVLYLGVGEGDWTTVLSWAALCTLTMAVTLGINYRNTRRVK